ncbi:MAG: PfkB family carbohydrate kinase [Devosia sp.]
MTNSAFSVPVFATVGDNCVDKYIPLGKASIGGNALNVAVQLARQGERCTYFGAVGGDDAGEWTRSALATNGVSVDRLRVLDAPTAYTNLDVDSSGDRIFTLEEFGACAIYYPSDDDVAALRQVDHIHIGWFRGAARLRERLAGSGVTFSQDVAVNPDSQGLDVAFESVGPSEEHAREALARLLAAGARVAVVTCGSMGSMASDGRTTERTGIRAVDVVETTGAGDTFIAAFLASWKRGHDLRKCLEAGRDLAAETCTHVGGFPQTLRDFK